MPRQGKVAGAAGAGGFGQGVSGPPGSGTPLPWTADAAHKAGRLV